MKKTAKFLVLAFTAVLATFGPAEADELSISGAWAGELSLTGQPIRIVFNITEKEDGSLEVTMDSPDQGAKGIPAGPVTIAGDSVRIEVPVVTGFFSGIYERSDDTIRGDWHQSGFVIPLALSRGGEILRPRRPQDPVPPFPYTEREINFDNPSADAAFAGTLTIPEGAGPFPAVVLVTGSGPQDRNEEVLGHRPFLVLADHLAREGIAVLRYDDRGVGGSTGDRNAATTLDFAGDASAAVSFLRRCDDAEIGAIGIAGHSEGALIASMIASNDQDISFIVMLGGPGLDGDEILLMQTEAICLASGFGEELTAKVMDQKRLEHSILRSEPDPEKARELLIEHSSEYFSNYSQEELDRIGYSPTLLEQRASIYLTPWFRFFMSYDPAPTLAKVRCPVLALWGEKDLQVPPEENMKAVARALADGGSERNRLEVIPGLNHLFQHCGSGSPDEYGTIEETFAPDALEIISSWILEITGR